jgi:hypothetical protein
LPFVVVIIILIPQRTRMMRRRRPLGGGSVGAMAPRRVHSSSCVVAAGTSGSHHTSTPTPAGRTWTRRATKLVAGIHGSQLMRSPHGNAMTRCFRYQGHLLPPPRSRREDVQDERRVGSTLGIENTS